MTNRSEPKFKFHSAKPAHKAQKRGNNETILPPKVICPPSKVQEVHARYFYLKVSPDFDWE